MSRFLRLVAVAAIVLSASCRQGPVQVTRQEPSRAEQATPQRTSRSTGVVEPPTSMLPNILVKVEGRVEVRRSGRTQFVPVGLGTELEVGDILRVEGAAEVFCGNEILWEQSPFPLRSGDESGVPCVAGRRPRPAPDVSGLRGGASGTVAEIPYVLRPRSGFVLSDRPDLRWHVLSGTEVYTVTLESDDSLERSPVTGHGAITYPEEWPPLQAGGASYRVVVQGGGRRSDWVTDGAEGFSLLDRGKARQLHDQVERLRQRPIEEPALTLLIAELYLSYLLRSDAAAVLQDLADGAQVAAVQRLLGETYLSMGLFREAEEPFQQALALDSEGNLMEGVAEDRLGLGYAACGQGDVDEARAQWSLALTLFEELDMEAKAIELRVLVEYADSEC